MKDQYVMMIVDLKSQGHLWNGPVTDQELYRFAEEFGFQSGSEGPLFSGFDNYACLLQKDNKPIRKFP
jgi:hypothetical protein